MNYTLNSVRIYVTDWERSLEFYSETLGMPVLYSSSEFGWAELDTGAAHLALERIDPKDSEAAELVGRFVSVSLEVDDIQSTYETLLSRDVDFVEPPERQPWGGTLAHFRDLDGNILTLLGSTPSED